MLAVRPSGDPVRCRPKIGLSNPKAESAEQIREMVARGELPAVCESDNVWYSKLRGRRPSCGHQLQQMTAITSACSIPGRTTRPMGISRARDLIATDPAKQVALRRAVGVIATHPFASRTISPALRDRRPEAAAGQIVWLLMPIAAPTRVKR